jgi:hypothetical protein
VTNDDVDPDAGLDAFRARLRETDYVLGLQAELRTAKERAEREEKLRKQLERRIARQKARIQQLERQGLVGFLRRVKRKLTS